MNITMMNGTDGRTQRARSAPPAPSPGSMPQNTFVSTANHDPTPQPPQQQPQQQQQPQGGKGKVIPIIHEVGSNSSKNSPNTGKSPQRQQNENSGAGNVRHIPIFVEGRDKPVISQQQNNTPQQQQKVSRPPADDNDGRKCSSPSQTPPMKKPNLPATPLELIQRTRDEAVELEKLVDQSPGGQRRDRRYAELEEMLTRKLLELDNIETEGKEEIRQTRKDCIKYILSCLAKLEAKYPTQSATENNCMEVEVFGQTPTAKTDDDVSDVEQPLALMALPDSQSSSCGNQNENSSNGNSNVIQPTAIPLPMPASETQNVPKKSESSSKVVKMEVTLAPPSDQTNNTTGQTTNN